MHDREKILLINVGCISQFFKCFNAWSVHWYVIMKVWMHGAPLLCSCTVALALAVMYLDNLQLFLEVFSTWAFWQKNNFPPKGQLNILCNIWNSKIISVLLILTNQMLKSNGHDFLAFYFFNVCKIRAWIPVLQQMLYSKDLNSILLWIRLESWSYFLLQ